MCLRPPLQLNRKLSFFLTEQARYKVAYGGRGSGKSWDIARSLLVRVASSSEPQRILCCREIQQSIRDSVHKLLRDQIDLLGFGGFIVQNDRILHTNGSEFLFKGLSGNVAQIKSMEGIDVCWIEEAETITAQSWELLDPTIRKEGSEIWISFNPRYKDDVIYDKFITNTPDNAIVKLLNFADNPHFPQVLRAQMEQMRRNDPDLYRHIWLGEIKQNTSELVLAYKWACETFEAPKDAHRYFGADWGFSNDPNTLITCYIAPHKDFGDYCLWIDYELCDRPYNDSKRQTSTDITQLPDFWRRMPVLDSAAVVLCDNARPETIAFMRRNGFNAKPCAKGKGSIEEGITAIRGFDKVIIHPRCINTAYEFGNYKFAVDKYSGQPTNKIVDENNHLIDALRYALEPVMRRKVSFL